MTQHGCECPDMEELLIHFSLTLQEPGRWAGRDNRTLCIHLHRIGHSDEVGSTSISASTSKDLTAPANAVGSTSRRADGVAASISTVDIELVSVKDDRSSTVAATHGSKDDGWERR